LTAKIKSESQAMKKPNTITQLNPAQKTQPRTTKIAQTTGARREIYMTA